MVLTVLGYIVWFMIDLALIISTSYFTYHNWVTYGWAAGVATSTLPMLFTLVFFYLIWTIKED